MNIGGTFARAKKPANYNTLKLLIEAYDRYNTIRCNGPRKRSTPWMREHLVRLGQLYVEAWGELPTMQRCRNTFNMPEMKAINRVFGGLAGYHHAIQSEEYQDAH